MNLDFSDDQKALGEQARRFLSERSSSAVVRRVIDTNSGYDRELWQALAELGYLGLAIPENYGGAGLSYLDLCMVASELGRALAPVPVASSIYLAAEFLLQAGSEQQKKIYLPQLVSGQAIGTFAYAEANGEVRPDSILSRVSAGKLTGHKVAVPDADTATHAVVAAFAGSTPQSLSLYLVDLTAVGVTRKQVSTIDPSRGCADITFKDVQVEPLGPSGAAIGGIAKVLDRAAVLVAFEQVGGAERALEVARDYAMQRTAFGRLIGSFQALKHMMADMYVSATLARSNAYYGAWALCSDAAELPYAAALSRVSATQAFQQCAKNCIQVHGGMGFTWEFDCHLYYRRSNQLALTLGSQSEWEDLLIARMQAADAASVGE
jgi:alkylation response protein AidB-like acyl-CoA dehydrogenase